MWEIQGFECEQLGRRVARLDLPPSESRPCDLPTLLSATVDELREAGVRMASCRVPENDTEAVLALQRAGFEVMECLLTLSMPVGAAAVDRVREGTDGLSLAGAEEAEACGALAERIFTHDRYHVDPRIEDALADRLKGSWARNACRGRADSVFAVRDGEMLIGFNACMIRDRTAVIDLIGVDPRAHGRGHGRRLVLAALDHYRGRADTLSVGTQSRNIPSLGLYQAAGFRIAATAFTLHLHL